jgi:ABC-type multidrug transport system ATPase subunit
LSDKSLFPVKIEADNAGKKFIFDWVVRKVSFSLERGQSYTFTGPNGSGKSTILQLIMGAMPLSEGHIHYYTNDGRKIDQDKWYKYLVLASPYLEVIEEFTLPELIAFHKKFKPLKGDISSAEFIDFVRLSGVQNKLIRHYSSGMKQRVRLGLALLSDVPVVLLDEPTSNLDKDGISWYLEQVNENNFSEQLLLIASNQTYEYEFCKNIISVQAFK